MNIVVNGEVKNFENDATLADVLKKMALEDKVMAAAVNMNIVKQDSWNGCILKDGDKLELLDFVGGG